MAKKQNASKKRASQNKIKKYRKPVNLNIGMIIFVAIFVYVVICVVMYFQTSHIVRYEVKEGSLATNNMYRGVVIRDEVVVNADSAGYVNYYAREGERVGNGSLVYTLDETGTLNTYLENMAQGENTLSEKELAEFRSEIVNFMHNYDSGSYSSTYDFKYSLKNTVLKLASNNMLQNINSQSGAEGTAASVKFCYAPQSGVVSYWTDGYEQLQPEDVTKDVFDDKEYEKKQLINNELVGSGSAAYKMTVDENWSIVIPVDAERGAEMQQEEYIKVRFMKNQYDAWGKVKLLHNGDGNTYVQLSFTNSMVSFVSERFLDVELILNDEKGLKIPKSSIVEKEFFLVPEEFVCTEEKDGQNGVHRQTYKEDGTVTVEFVAMDLYSYDEKEKKYYLDNTILDPGDILHRTDSQDTFVVSERATLMGVYNVNKGYADFKQIIILYQNDEYAIVKTNTQYGLNVYDYIALDAASVSDDQFITE